MDDLISREEALAGTPERHARSQLFVIENTSAQAEAQAQRVTAAIAEQWDEAERDEAFLDAYRIARTPGAAPTIKVLERHSHRWRNLVPHDPRLRAALAHVIAAKYTFTRRCTPGIRTALGMDTIEVQQAYREQFGAELDGVYAAEQGVPLWRLLLIFLGLGATAIGGKSTQSYLFQEFVRRREWIAPDDFAECYTLAKLLPGPTGANMTVAVGQLLHGLGAALLCLLAFALPGSLLIFVLCALLIGQELPHWAVTGLAGGAAAALGLLLASSVQMGSSSRKARWWLPFLLASFAGSALLHLNFVVVLLGLGALSLAANAPRRRAA